MEPQAPQGGRLLVIFCGLAAAAPCIFFAYYSLRLLYVNLTMPDAVAHRTGGMLIGAVAFPLAAIVSGAISWLLIRKGLRADKLK
jgi:hypothetical protein